MFVTLHQLIKSNELMCSSYIKIFSLRSRENQARETKFGDGLSAGRLRSLDGHTREGRR